MKFDPNLIGGPERPDYLKYLPQDAEIMRRMVEGEKGRRKLLKKRHRHLLEVIRTLCAFGAFLLQIAIAIKLGVL